MTWTAPKLDEVSCGMEINMCYPAEALADGTVEDCPAEDGDKLF